MSILQRFLKMEAASGILLFCAMILAFIWCNSPWAQTYFELFHTPLTLQLGTRESSYPLVFWINEGLMTLFFLLIGIELKKEMLEGRLNSLRHIALPGFAAFGGMLIPSLIYLLVNLNNPATLKGWPIPVATDIAFALGVLSFFGKKVPIALKLFLMALAIFDDLGAVVIIALYHFNRLIDFYLACALILWIGLLILDYINVKSLGLYAILGVGIWFFILQSGVHPTIAGVLIAIGIPLSLAKKIEVSIHPWVSYGVVPLFAFANAGLSFNKESFSFIFNYIPLGIILGLVIGKQLGVFGFAYFVIKKGWASLPHGGTWLQLYGVAILCGIGFTMSLFLGNLVFAYDVPEYLVQVRLGVFLGSILSGMLGGLILLVALRSKGGRFETSK